METHLNREPDTGWQDETHGSVQQGTNDDDNQECNDKHRPVTRGLCLDDLFRMEKIGRQVFSPDGQWLAYERVRSAGRSSTPRLTYHSEAQTDIWLVPVVGGEPQNITDGERGGWGFWNPLWSPSGRYVAFLSIQTARIRAWVYEPATGEKWQLTEHGIRNDFNESSITWISEHELACLAWPLGGDEPGRLHADTLPGDYAMRVWPRAWTGRETTVQILDSGTPADIDSKNADDRQSNGSRPGPLVVVDVVDKQQRIIAEGELHVLRSAGDGHGLSWFEATSPIAPLEAERPLLPEQLLAQKTGTRLSLASCGMGGDSVSWVEDVTHPLPDSLQWSPDGIHLALLGYDPKDIQAGAPNGYTLYLVNAAEAIAKRLTCQGLLVEEFVWSGANQLVVRAAPVNDSGTVSRGGRADWWRVGENGRWRNLTRKLKSVPQRLIAIGRNGALLGIAGGELWYIDAQSPRRHRVTMPASSPVESVAWPLGARHEAQPVNQIVVLCGERESVQFFEVRLSAEAYPPREPAQVQVQARLKENTQVREIQKPHVLASFGAYAGDRHTGSSTAAFSSSSEYGTYLWQVDSTTGGTESGPGVPEGGQTQTLVETDLWLRDIQFPDCHGIRYRSLNGQEKDGLLFLPLDYKEGERYPLVTYVYPGITIRDSGKPLFNRWRRSFHECYLLATQGYAVLMPSMPRAPRGAAGEPYLELPDGVLPAIDKVIEMGIADPQRLGVMGHSFGGFATYGLISQTRRFQAAVAMAGMSNFVSHYGTFDVRGRYGDLWQPQQHQAFQMLYFENGQGAMGQPPWRDPLRYWRNSPLSFVERVETPLLIVQGDNDFVPISQGEEFFSALYRLGKRARFLRYRGEGHNIEGRANLHHMWQQIFAWFEMYLMA